MPPKKLEKLKSLIKLVDESISEEDFLRAFKAVVDHIKQMEEGNLKIMRKLTTLIEETLEKARSRISDGNEEKFTSTVNSIEKAKTEALKAVEVALKEQATGMNLIRDKLREFRNEKDGKDGVDGSDGKDADEDAIFERLLEKIPEKTENFDATEILEMQEEHKKEIEELKKRPVGGVTNMRIQQAFKYILKTEAPVGNVDGSNLTYTVSQPIFAILAFSMNKAVIAQIPNYTINGNKITFSTALPSVYSGKDFEVKYI